MANILTATEASNVLRCAVDDADMLALLPLVDAYIKNATGRDWTLDATIRPEAKQAARILLVRAHEDPGAMSQPASSLSWGLSACLMQLEALAILPEISGVPDERLALVQTNIGLEMAIDCSILLVFNHEMADAATSKVYIEGSDGGSFASTNTLDVTKKIMTIKPSTDLAKGSAYIVVIDHAADIYGQALDWKVGFTIEDS